MAGVTYALPDERASMQRARELNRDINTEIGDEDIKLIEWAAAGMRSSAFDGVLLSDLELGIASFQNRLREVLPVVALEQEPKAGSLQQVNERMRAQGKVAAVS
jgi:phenylpropionate dioxygenase-like ring-hydroxylating dioxygenase large terminal subunit